MWRRSPQRGPRYSIGKPLTEYLFMVWPNWSVGEKGFCILSENYGLNAYQDMTWHDLQPLMLYEKLVFLFKLMSSFACYDIPNVIFDLCSICERNRSSILWIFSKTSQLLRSLLLTTINAIFLKLLDIYRKIKFTSGIESLQFYVFHQISNLTPSVKMVSDQGT